MPSPTNDEKRVDPQEINHNLPKSEYTHVIALVHGIRDIGAWQKTVASELMVVRGVQVVQIRYGLFSAWRFLFPLPIFFHRPTKKVVDGLRNLRSEYPNAKLSVIAHSFGTFLTLRALKQDSLIQLWKIVFCGSVADDLGDWSALRQRVGDNNLPTKEFIVNDCGTGDPWPVLATAFGWHFGMAGSVGFSEEYVTNRFHRGIDAGPGGHSLYFEPEFVSRNWKPFLIDNAPIGSGDGVQGEHLSSPIRVLYSQAAQWLAKVAALTLWLAVPVCLLLAMLSWKPWAQPPDPNPNTTTQAALEPTSQQEQTSVPEPKKTLIRLGMKQWVGYTPLGVAQELQLFPKEVDVRFVNVDTVGQMGTFLSNDEIELAMGLVESHVRECQEFVGAENSPNRPVALLKLDTSRGADGIVVRRGIRSMADLGLVDGEERKFLFQHHDVSGYLFRHWCRISNVNFRDFKLFRKNASPEDAAKMFSTDSSYFAVGTYDPYLTFLRKEGNSLYVKDAELRIHSDQDGVRDTIVDIMVTKAKHLDVYGDAIRDVMEGWFRAVDVLTDDTHELYDDALAVALKFNATTEPDDWNALTWTENDPCDEQEYFEMLEGLRGLYREKKEKAWADRTENVAFFRTLGGTPSQFHKAFDYCKEIREGTNLDALEAKAFDGSIVVLEFKRNE